MPEKTSKELIEEIKGDLTKYQTEHTEKVKSLGEDGVSRDETLKKMETNFGELTVSLQAVTDKVTAEEQRLKDLELVIARGVGNTDKKGELDTTDEIKAALYDSLKIKGYTAPRETVEANFKEHVDHYCGHLTADKKELMVKNLMTEGSESAGGMWCPVPLDSRIRRRVFETTPLRQDATVMNINNRAMDFPLDDEEIETATSGEIGTRSETNTPEWAKVTIDVNELYAKPKSTLSLLEDASINMEAWLAGKASRKFSRDQNNAFAVGDGVQKARGVLDYSDASIEVYERNKIGTMDTATAITLAGDDLIDIQSHLLEEYQANAKWYMHRLIWALCMKLKDDEGRYLLNPLVLFQGAAPILLGAPVRMAGDYPNLTAGVLVDNQFILTYGDMREAYTILDRLGINVIRDNITESGFVKWFFRMRYGGAVTNFQAYKRLRAKAA